MHEAKEPSQQKRPSDWSPSTVGGPNPQLRVTGATSPSFGSKMKIHIRLDCIASFTSAHSPYL